MKNNMKISQFIIATEQDDNPNTYLLYNTHTTAFVAMEKEKYNKIFIEKNFKEDCVQQLHKMGFLVDDDFDELAALEELRIKGMSDPVQNVTLLTTTECNARCYYCFENGIKQYPMTKKVADVARALDIPCEAELGKVGGKEDDLEADADTNTDPQEAKEFAERTGVTSLAVAIGTAHGFYAGTPVLDTERVSEIRQMVEVPLVLHGASGLSDDQVRECVKRGMCKVNFATELRDAYSKAVKETFAENENTIDPKAYGKAAIKAVKELVMYRMKVCGCDGKA